ncbi:MAG: hypothetical protein R2883_01630 [Caldisericia bacterium]
MNGNKITAIAEGEVTITALCGLVEDKCKIKILEKGTHERSYSMFGIECEKNELEVGETTNVQIHVCNSIDNTNDIEIECYIREPF